MVYDACNGSVTSAEALADPYDRAITFTTGLFQWPDYAGVINDSHFVTRDRMGRTMAFVARAVKDGLVTGGAAWGVGVEEGGSLFIDRDGTATEYGKDAYVVLGDHQPEQAAPRKPLTYSGVKIWRLAPGTAFDFGHRPTCGYYLRSVVGGVLDADPYSGTPVTDCGSPTGSALTESEPNDTRDTADDATALPSPKVLTGTMKSATDRDHFAVGLASGRTAAVSCAVAGRLRRRPVLAGLRRTHRRPLGERRRRCGRGPQLHPDRLRNGHLLPRPGGLQRVRHRPVLVHRDRRLT